MQIRNGMWMVKDGLEVHNPSQVYSYKVMDNKLYIYCPFVRVEHRGNTLDGGMITGEISVTDTGVYFNFYHFSDLKESLFSNEINVVSGLEVCEKDGYIHYGNKNHGVRINKSSCEIEIFKGSEVVTTIPTNSLTYIRDYKFNGYMMAATKLDVQEKIYGLGERFTEYIKNGQSVVLSNEDGGTASNQAYKNIPFAVSSKNYGVFVDHSEIVEFEIGSELVSKNQFSVAGEQLRFEIICGENVGDVVSTFSQKTGSIPRLPEWSYGLWLSTSFTTEYNEETVLKFIDEMDSREIPFTTFHFDSFWMKEFEWMNFEFNQELFPDPKGLLDKIHNRGKKICVWINPYIGQQSPAYNEAKEGGYFIKTKDNKPWQWDKWQAGLGVIDFTNPEATKWYKDKLRTLVKLGVDSFKTDFGERIPVPNDFYETDVINYFDQSDPYEMHNYYTYLYNKAVYEVLEEENSSEPAVLFARSGTVGSQSLPVHWGGDCLSNYVSMAESLRGGLSLALSGYTYWSHDIGGFEAGCNPDIYKRWTQFGLLSSHSRYHGNSEYKVPWLYGDEAVTVTKKFSELKNSIMPYFKQMEDQAVESNKSMMRPLIYDFTSDRTTHYVDTQFMLGDSLMVAPIFNDQGTCEYYLPKGYKWYNILTEEIKNGGTWYNEKFDYLTLPLLLKEGSCLVVKNETLKTSFDVKDGFKIYAFNVTEEQKLNVINEGKESTIVIDSNGIKDNGGLEFDLITV